MLKKLFKLLFSAVIWVFIFSIEIHGRTLFSYANESLVKNSMIQSLDRELGLLWSRLSQSAKMAFSEYSKTDQDKLTY